MAYLKQEFLSVSSRLYRIYKGLRRYVSLQHYLKMWIQKRQFLTSDVKKIIAISKMVKSDIMEYYGVREDKIAVILNCVDLERFHPKNREAYRQVKRKALGIDDRALILLFAGNNYRLKGLEPLLRALTLLCQWFPDKNLRLLIAGRGRAGRYARLARRLGVSGNAVFLGSVGDMEQYYGASDIYVHPTFYDPCSLTVLEALASGLPVITTRFNGAADAIASGEGGTVIDDPRDIKDLAQAIAYYFAEERRDRARRLARKWMEGYPPSQHVEQILKVYYEVTGQTRV
jgi:UDP-glucose:(heptosyl)LPS alpha-1,3-glucosyltransferase